MNNVSMPSILPVVNANDRQFQTDRVEGVRINSEKNDFSDTLKAVKQKQTKVDNNEKADSKPEEITVMDSNSNKVDEKSVEKAQGKSNVENTEVKPKEENKVTDKKEKESDKQEDGLDDLILLLQQFVSLLDEKDQAVSTNENNELNFSSDGKTIGSEESILASLIEKIKENADDGKDSTSDISVLLGKNDVGSILNILKDKMAADKDGKEINPKLNDVLSLMNQDIKDEKLDLSELSLIVNNLSKDESVQNDSDLNLDILNQLAAIINNKSIAGNKNEITKLNVQELNPIKDSKAEIDTLTSIKNLVDKVVNSNIPNEDIKAKIQELKTSLLGDKKIDKLHLKSILSELIQANDKSVNESTNKQDVQEFSGFVKNRVTQYKSQIEGTVAQTREGKLLESLTKDNVDKTDNKISKLNMLMGSLTSTARQLDNIDAPNVLPTVNKATVVQDVIKSIKYMELNNMKELTVKMNPKNLGEMAIKITSVGGSLSASITVKDKDVYNTINANLNDIKAALNSQNIKVNEVSVNIYNDQSNYFSQSFGESGFNGKQGNNNGQTRTDAKDFIDEDIAEVEEELSLGNLNILA